MTALALAERLDMPRLASDIRTTLVGLEQKGGPSESLVEALRSAIDGAVEAGAANTELRALLLLGNHHLDQAEFAEADAAFSRCDHARQGRGHPWVPYAAEARWMHARLAGHAGPVGRRARACSTPPRRWSRRSTTRCWPPRAPRSWWRAASPARRSWPAACGRSGARRGWSRPPAGRPSSRLPSSPATRPGRARDVPPDHRHAHQHLAPALPGAGPARRDHARGLRHRRRPPQRDRAAGRRAAGRPGSSTTPSGARAPRRSPALVGSREPRLGGAGRGRAAALALGRRRRPARPGRAGRGVARARRPVRGVRRALRAGRVRANLAEILAATGDPAGARALTEAAPRDRPRAAAPRRCCAGSARPPPRPLRSAGPRATLTPRESEILALVAEGRTNGEIGRQLFISTKTVSVHVSNILGKLGASGRTEAAAIARRDGPARLSGPGPAVSRTRSMAGRNGAAMTTLDQTDTADLTARRFERMRPFGGEPASTVRDPRAAARPALAGVAAERRRCCGSGTSSCPHMWRRYGDVFTVRDRARRPAAGAVHPTRARQGDLRRRPRGLPRRQGQRDPRPDHGRALPAAPGRSPSTSGRARC